MGARARRTAHGENGAYQRFERGEIALAQFYDAWGRELNDVSRGNAAYAGYCAKRALRASSRPGVAKENLSDSEAPPAALPASLSIDARDVRTQCTHMQVAQQAFVCAAFRADDAPGGRGGRGRCTRDRARSRYLLLVRRCHNAKSSRVRAARGLRAIALTNNYSKDDAATDAYEREHLGWDDGAVPVRVRELFDDWVDSSIEGLRCVPCRDASEI